MTNLWQFVGNARSLRSVSPDVLRPFALACDNPPTIGGDVYPSHHHAAIVLCERILAVVEALRSSPTWGPEPDKTAASIEPLVLAGPLKLPFDPAVLRQQCGVEAARSGHDTDAEGWRGGSRVGCSDGITVEFSFCRIPAADDRPAGTPAAAHADCVAMLDGLAALRLPIDCSHSGGDSESKLSADSRKKKSPKMAYMQRLVMRANLPQNRNKKAPDIVRQEFNASGKQYTKRDVNNASTQLRRFISKREGKP